jgi:hypothetical protein
MTFPAVCPVADKVEWLPNDMGGELTHTFGLVGHVNAGNGDPWGWFNRSDVQASSHFQLMKSGLLIQYVPLNRIAWTEVAGNADWHACESEGWPNEPYTEAALAKYAALWQWGIPNLLWTPQVTDSPFGRGFGTHSMGGVAWGGHACPGDIRAAQRQEILNRAASGRNKPATSESSAQFIQDHWPLLTPGRAADTHPLHIYIVRGLLAAHDRHAITTNGIRTGGLDMFLQNAVRDFQTSRKLVADGIPGPKTITELLDIKDGWPLLDEATGKTHPQQVRNVKGMLAAHGAWILPVNSNWDEYYEGAVGWFQDTNRLIKDFIVGPASIIPLLGEHG